MRFNPLSISPRRGEGYRPILRFLLSASFLLAGINGYADVVKINLLEPKTMLKIMPKVNPARPIALKLSAEPSPELEKVPDSFDKGSFTSFTLGPAEKKQTFSVALADISEEKEALDNTRLLIDRNGNGDVSDDTPVACSRRTFNDADGRKWTEFSAQTSVSILYGDHFVPVPVFFTWYDKESAKRIGGVRSLRFSVLPARGGEVRLGETTYPIMLIDTLAQADYRGISGSQVSGILLLVDVNGNGAFDARGEAFDTAKPFTIRGVTYQIQNVSASGETLAIVKSKQSVPEIPPPPDLRPGKLVVPFLAKTITGKSVHFPQDYKGRLVLLLFWASWCGDCRAELPFLTETYRQFHSQGLDILGVSLDREEDGKSLPDFLKKNGMEWLQVYDGKFWKTEFADLYGITWIPTLYLVDGDSGTVIAAGEDVLGKKLKETVSKAIKDRKR